MLDIGDLIYARSDDPLDRFWLYTKLVLDPSGPMNVGSEGGDLNNVGIVVCKLHVEQNYAYNKNLSAIHYIIGTSTSGWFLDGEDTCDNPSDLVEVQKI